MKFFKSTIELTIVAESQDEATTISVKAAQEITQGTAPGVIDANAQEAQPA